VGGGDEISPPYAAETCPRLREELRRRGLPVSGYSAYYPKPWTPRPEQTPQFKHDKFQHPFPVDELKPAPLNLQLPSPTLPRAC
jgi:hypothetical protein